jgi:hypothetical protein
VTFFLEDLSDNATPLSVATRPHGLAVADNKAPLAIGRAGRGPISLFDGLIDDVRLSRGPLDVEESLRTDESPTAATLAHWTFEPAPGPYRDVASAEGGLDLTPARPMTERTGARRKALADLCHVLLNSNEFLYVP